MCNKNANQENGDAHFQIFQQLYNYLLAKNGLSSFKVSF